VVAWEPIGNRAPTAAMTSYRCGFRTCSGQRSRRIRCGNRCGNHCGNRRQTTIHAGTGEARSQREWGHMQPLQDVLQPFRKQLAVSSILTVGSPGRDTVCDPVLVICCIDNSMSPLQYGYIPGNGPWRRAVDDCDLRSCTAKLTAILGGQLGGCSRYQYGLASLLDR